MPQEQMIHCFVTGGSRGVGLAFATLAVQRGMFCSILDRQLISEQVGIDLLRSGRIDFYQGDITREADVEQAISAAIDKRGYIVKYFNNAGILGSRAPLHRTDEKDWDDILVSNLKGTWNCLRYQLGAIREDAPISIVNNTSISGIRGSANYPLYSAAKHGIVGLTRSAALCYGSQGVRINAICSGIVETAMTEQERICYGGSSGDDAKLIPLGRTGMPTEIASCAHWLLSDDAAYINGHTLVVDGGLIS